MMRSRSSTRCEMKVSSAPSFWFWGSLTPALGWNLMRGTSEDQKKRVGRRRLTGVCRATRAAPDCTRVRRETARLYQVGVAVCLTRQFLRFGAALVLTPRHEVPSAAAAADSSVAE